MEEIQEGDELVLGSAGGRPGIKAHRPPKDSGSTMGGWYAAHGLYVPEELDGLSVQKFCEAVRAEGTSTGPGANLLLHLHPVLNDADVYGDGKPTRIAHSDQDVRQGEGSLPVTERMTEQVYSIPCSSTTARDYQRARRSVPEGGDTGGRLK